MEIEKYIPNDIQEDVGVEDVSQGAKSKTQAVKKKKTTSSYESKQVSAEDHEITRKRDILASVALLDGLESYIGENISAVQIRNMKKEKLESYFMLYQEKAGQEVTNDMMSSLVEMSVKGLSYAVDIDNEEDLKNDLVNIKQLRRTIGRQAAEIAEKYGDFVTIFKVLFTVGKHISSFSLEKYPTSTSAGKSTSTILVEK